jgi:UDP-N-acetylmuramate--alanine ligase
MKYHLIGIGGIGMSGIARLLLAKGDEVTGSDLRRSEITDELKAEGVKIIIGHKNDTIANFAPEVVVYSAAITDYSPGYVELLAAKKMKIKTLRRAEMIRELMKGKSGIAVSGMHGKTTTTSMIASILIGAKLKPTSLIGGIADKIKSNAQLGSGKYFVVEACEYDNTFLEFIYDRAVITNIEKEHLEYFGNIDNILKTFKKFVEKIPANGLLVAFGDNENVRNVISQVQSRVITYGLSKDNDVVIENFQIGEKKVSFSLKSKKVDLINKDFELQIPGMHNALNAAAAVIIAKDLKIDEAIIHQELYHFSGIKRRMEIYDEINGILVMDDYAHHPTEIFATLEALREFYDNRRIIVIFRPAQYSRNKALLTEYGKAFLECDLVIIPKTYEPAGRDKEEDKSIDSKRMTEEIVLNHQKALYLPEFSQVIEYLKSEAKKGDLIITMGLGPLYELTKQIVEMLTSRSLDNTRDRQARGKKERDGKKDH